MGTSMLRYQSLGKNYRGVTLIEVLVTILVLSVGLLGVASLQIFSLQTSQVTAQRTIALNLAYQITDDWRTNSIQCGGTDPTLSDDIQETWERKFSASADNPDAAVFLGGGSATATCDSNRMVTVTIRWPTGRFEEEFAPGDTDRLEELVLVTRI